MNKCRRCGAQFDGADICPGCGASDYAVMDAESKREPMQAVPDTSDGPDAEPSYEPKHYPARETVRGQAHDPERSPAGQPPHIPNGDGRNYRAGHHALPAPVTPDTGAKGLAVAALVTGILSLIFFLSSYIGIILGVIAVCFGGVSRKRLPYNERGTATAGFVTGLIGLILSVVIYIISAIFLVTLINIISAEIAKTSLIATIPYLPYN